MINPFEKLADVLAVKSAASSTKYKTPDDLEILRYGIYVLITDMVKTTVLLTTAYLLGLIQYTIFAIAAIGLLRIFVGGVHAKTFWGCLIANSSMLLSVSYLSANIIKHFSLILFIISLTAILITTYLYAPSDIENKPVRGKKHRRKLRTISFSIIFAYSFLIYFLRNNAFSVILTFSFLVNSVMILPVTYRITKNRTGEYYDQKVVIAKDS